MKSWADMIREALAEQTQYAFSQRTGLRQQTLSKILNGSDPRLSTAEQIGRALGFRLVRDTARPKK